MISTWAGNTQNCVRATSITTLDHKGIEARHIIGVSGHKSENSIKSYSAKLSDDKKRQMSDILSENIAPVSPKHVKMCKSSTTNTITLTVPPQPHVMCPAQVPNPLELEMMDDCDFDKILAEISEHELCGENSNPKPLRNNFNFSNCQITFNFPK